MTDFRQRHLVNTDKIPDNTSQNIGTPANSTALDVNQKWGRCEKSSWANTFFSLAIMSFCPFFVLYFWSSLKFYNGELSGPLLHAISLTKSSETPISDLVKLVWGRLLPSAPSNFVWSLYFGWLVFQALAYAVFPWPRNLSQGQVTPAGHLLSYRTNGLAIWIFTHAGLFMAFSILNMFSETPKHTETSYFEIKPVVWNMAALIAENWEGLLFAANVYGYALTVFAYIKAHLWPSHVDDCKFSGSILYDIYMGVELNPRFGRLWDFKLFHNGRPGILSWTLINISFAALQHQRYGFVSNSMILVNVLQALYVLDFFYNEDWYLRTIDIAHDHFGFYLAWGDSVWLPFMYTLQAQYLSHHPHQLPPFYAVCVLLIGLIGYFIFRTANHQKDLCRRTNGNCRIWGDNPPQMLRVQYKSADGKMHNSLLLLSGFWGWSKHFNYVGDLLQAAAMCLACLNVAPLFDELRWQHGQTSSSWTTFVTTNHLLPHFYVIYMFILLMHRTIRDQARCRGKYGQYWDEYCKIVPYNLFPYIY